MEQQSSEPSSTMTSSGNADPPPMLNGVVNLVYDQNLIVQLYPSQPTDLDSVDPSVPIAVDSAGGFAMLGTKTGYYIWKYESRVPDTEPFYLHYSTFIDYKECKVVLMPSTVGQSKPIVVAIHAEGHVEFQESNHCNLHRRPNRDHPLFADNRGVSMVGVGIDTLNLFSNRLGLVSGERVLAVTSIDPIGVVVYTTCGRLFLLQLLDENGSKTLQVQTVTADSSSLHAGWCDAIVSVRSGEHSDDRSKGLFYTINSGGCLSIWQSKLHGPVESRFIEELKELIFTGQSHASFQFHDVASLLQNQLYVLASTNHAENETRYVVVVISVDMSTRKLKMEYRHELKSYTCNFDSRPRLLFPRPGNALYVVFDGTVVALGVKSDSNELLSKENTYALPMGDNIFAASAGSNGIVLISNRGAIGVEMRNLPNQTNPGYLRSRLEQVVFSLSEWEVQMATFDLRAATISRCDGIRFSVESVAFDIASGEIGGMSLCAESIASRHIYLTKLVAFALANFNLKPDTSVMLYNMVQKLTVLRTLDRYFRDDPTLLDKFKTATGKDWNSCFSLYDDIDYIMASLTESVFHTPIIDAFIAADSATKHMNVLPVVVQSTILPWIVSDGISAVLQTHYSMFNISCGTNFIVGFCEVKCLTSSLQLAWVIRHYPEQVPLMKTAVAKTQRFINLLLTDGGHKNDALRIISRFSSINASG